MRFRFFWLILVAVVGSAWAANRSPNTLQVLPTQQAATLAHFLAKGTAHNWMKVDDFRQREPGDGTPASRATTAYISYDNKNLYVVFICKDRPSDVRARLGRRESIEGDDMVSLYLDTFHDRKRAYIFSVNPLGVQRDGILTEGQKEDYSFDTLWQSEGQLTDDGFAVHMAIPFKSLRFPRTGSQTWGIALGRTIPRNSEEAYWPHISKKQAGFVQQMAVLEGLESISPGRNLQFIPYTTVGHSSFLDQAAAGGARFRTQNEARVGLDSKFVLRDAFTVDVAINPDFSQVESDEPQVTVNQRYEVFFPEKRPFFIENAGFFQTPVNLFFSRRVVDPQFGARLTGKVGRWAIGAIGIDDRSLGKTLEPDDPLYNQRAKIGVVRVQREFGGQSSVGLLVTNRDFASSYNRVFSADTRLQLNKNWILSGQVMRSYDRDLEGEAHAGMGYFAELLHNGKHFDYFTRYSDFGRDFRARRLGFVKRVDLRQLENEWQYKWRRKQGAVQKFGPTVAANFSWDHNQLLQDWSIEPSFKVELAGRTKLEVAREEAAERFEGVMFRRHTNKISAETEWIKWLGLTVSHKWGTNVNFDPPKGMDAFLAGETKTEFGFILRPASHMRIDQTYIFNRLRAFDDAPGGLAGRSVFNNHILRTKLSYQFTRALSLRTILDYQAVLPNTRFVDLDQRKGITADVLATYMVNPGTALHIGYTDRYDNLDVDGAGGVRLLRTPSINTGRQFYVKLSYMFRF